MPPGVGTSHINVFANLHDVTLQRLDVYQDHGNPVFYDSRFFAQTVDLWNEVPVIYDDVKPGKPAKHPDFEDVINGTLPKNYRVVGRISNAHITETGEKALKGMVLFSDLEIERMAAAGELSLSTGFSSPEAPDDRIDGATRISGSVIPNHVLVFRRGVCPNCYPNDNGAMFHNLKEEESIMDDESKSILKRIADALNKPAEAPQQQHVNIADYKLLEKELSTVKETLTELVNVMKTEKAEKTEKAPEVDLEKENLRKELEALKAKQAQDAADAAWNAMKVNLPEGWLGEKEAETRKLFETDPVTLFNKFAAFKNARPGEKPAEGSITAGAGDGSGDKDESAFRNLAAEFEKRYGIRVV